MPRKRKQNVSKALLHKQQQFVTTRLIQISMRVEDHLYKNIAISVEDAKSYYQEVMAYQPKCRHDIRSMQVIEKLSRCMKAIIQEHTECSTQTFDFNSTLTGNYCASPTYSETNETNDNNKANTVEIHVKNKNKVEDLTIDESLDIGPVKSTIDVEIHRAMSNLSIKKTQDLMEKITDCSQSILKHFDSSPVKDVLEKANKQDTRTYSNSESVNLKAIRKSAKNKHVLENSNNAKNKTIKRKRRTGEEILRDTIAKYSIEKQQKRKRNTTASKNTKKQVYDDKTISRNTQDTKNNEIQKVTKDLKRTANRTSEENIIKPLITNYKVNKKATLVEKEIPIYNRNIENDLSWIENIRYVREVVPDEFDRQYSNISDDFWANCSVPAFWNDYDFVI